MSGEIKPAELARRLRKIEADIEELIGIGLGMAPAEFYFEDDDGSRSVRLSEIDVFAKNAHDARERLLEIISELHRQK